MSVARTNWNYPTAIRFGAGRIAELAEACRDIGIARPLLVTDALLAGSNLVGKALAGLSAAGLPARVFSQFARNPTGNDIELGQVAYRDGGHDGVIAFGGGSALDVGKVIAFMSGQTRPLWDFEDRADWSTRADPNGIAPIVAVPTTAGTGSEVGRAGVILDQVAAVKKIIFHPKMLPAVVIMDPELTVGLPREVTAATGMDALSHCLEAYCAPEFHPLADGIAVEGIRLIREWLPVAFRDGRNLKARGNMLVAATMGATAFQKGLGAMHALSHPIGALCDTHHGLTNAVLMPYVLSFNRSVIEHRAGRLAAYLELPEQSFGGLLDWVLELRSVLGIPETLSALNVPADRLERIASMAEADPSAAGNPRPFDAAAALDVLQSAFAGRLASR